ncbi:MAG: GDP-mannose 4,6-dehydratase, partial [Proteobacteria bacterium]|nr:GDP-mannose 4,6-dehydratase [Pseudomonadota bacterium]
MKPDLSNDEFQKLEKTCLLLDILIDCEEYDEFDNIVFEQIFQKFKKYSIFIQQIDNPTKEEVAKGIEAIVTRPFHSKYYEYFSIIITSKYIRRLLAENKKGIKTEKTEKLFEELTETLIKIIRKRSDDANTNILRLIFLNEISASSAGNLAKGYADIVLDELRGLNQKWHLKKGNEKSIKHPYELYALYNIGLAFLHDRTMEGTSEMAIETFRQILKPFNNENSENTLRTNFSNEYKSYKNLFDIFFWLIYIPTQNLTVEAFSDQNSSRNREETIEEALGKIKDTPVTLKNGDELDLRIKNYHKSQLTIQLSLAKIDSGYFTADLMYGAGEYEWLNAFKVHSEDSIEPLEKLSEFIPPLDKHPNIKNKLDTAKAIFWLENAMASQEIHNRQESCIKSFDLCIDHLKNQQSSDWSDFAIILLDNVLFLLEKQNSEFSEQIIYKDKTRSKPKNRPKEFQKYYKKILDDLVRRGWIQRKKELTEKFLKCQDKLLGHYEKKPQMAKYLGYQIKLVKSIKGDIDNKNFQKKWSEQGKIKLIKQLRYYVDLCNKNDLKKKFEKEIKETRENIFPEEDKLDDLRDFIKRRLNCDFYHKKLRFNTEAFNDHLIYKSCRPSLQNCYGLTVLRRWQSFTPALSSGSEVGEKGGGYFVYKTNDKGEIEEGIVVDPGFNFLENFFDEGFSIRDINAILLTHSHRDHSSDLMSIITLVHEMNKRGKRVFKKQWKNTKLVLFMTEGCYYKYEKQIGHESIKSFRDIIKVKCGKEYGEITALGAIRLLESIRKTNNKIKFYQASSLEIFGGSKKSPQNEETCPNPKSPYGAAKLYAHWMVKNYRETYNMFAVSGILFNHESPRRGLEYVTRKITHEAVKIKLGMSKELKLGNLDAEKDWGFAGDYVEAMWL